MRRADDGSVVRVAALLLLTRRVLLVRPMQHRQPVQAAGRAAAHRRRAAHHPAARGAAAQALPGVREARAQPQGVHSAWPQHAASGTSSNTPACLPCACRSKSCRTCAPSSPRRPPSRRSPSAAGSERRRRRGGDSSCLAQHQAQQPREGKRKASGLNVRVSHLAVICAGRRRQPCASPRTPCSDAACSPAAASPSRRAAGAPQVRVPDSCLPTQDAASVHVQAPRGATRLA